MVHLPLHSPCGWRAKSVFATNDQNRAAALLRCLHFICGSALQQRAHIGPARGDSVQKVIFFSLVQCNKSKRTLNDQNAL